MVILDVECYSNYFLLSLKQITSGKVKHFEMYPGYELDKRAISGTLSNHTTISFNGLSYDLPMITAALQGFDNQALKKLSDKIITSDAPAWMICRNNNIDVPVQWDHIDLIHVAPGQASLKIYGGRLNAKTMQDLPIPPEATITPQQRKLLRQYCENDLETTELLFQKLRPAIELRKSMSEQYGMDLRSKSDAQIAETVIKSELSKTGEIEFRGKYVKQKMNFPNELLLANEKAKELVSKGHSYTDAHMKAAEYYDVCPSKLGSIRAKLKKWRKGSMENEQKPQTVFRYQNPRIISFENQKLNDVFERILKQQFTLGANGSIQMPDWLKDTKIAIGNSQYQMGIGGLHSCEKSQYIEAGEGLLLDLDVSSYYPSIILQQKSAPKSLGEPFLNVYESLVNRRLNAKKSGDKTTADTLKIAVNGSFGKLGSKYSALYAPELLIQTTITGQLALLMLIERMEREGIAVVSANTDGVVCNCDKAKEQQLERIAWGWMLDTTYTLERTDYRLLASRDVNNYIGVGLNGKIKGKGCFAETGLMKNPDRPIIYKAVAQFLASDIPVEKTIVDCKDLTQFVTVRAVKGGAIWRGELLGKAIRFYHSTDCSFMEHIEYNSNGNKVPNSQGCKPVMTLPDCFPDDVDHGEYVKAAKKLLKEIGCNNA